MVAYRSSRVSRIRSIQRYSVRALAANALKYVQSGLTQSYLFLMVVGAAAIVSYLLG